MIYPEKLKTSRLIMKKPDLSDETINKLYEACSGEEGEIISQDTAWGVHSNIYETEQLVEEWLEEWNEREAINYLIIEKDSNNFIGMAGISTDWKRSMGELGCWLKKEYWGEGYGRERALALIQLSFEILGLSYITVRTDKNNKNSKKSIKSYLDEVGGEKKFTYREQINGKTRCTEFYVVTNIEYDNSGGLDVLVDNH